MKAVKVFETLNKSVTNSVTTMIQGKMEEVFMVTKGLDFTFYMT